MSVPNQDATQNKVTIRMLSTGVPGLDEILGGGLPEFSFNIIAGAPGGGKTTLAHIKSFSPTRRPNVPRFISPCWANPQLKCCAISSSFDFFDQSKVDRFDSICQSQPGRFGRRFGSSTRSDYPRSRSEQSGFCRG